MDPAENLFDDAVQKLKRTISQGCSFQAGQVRVIGLDKIKRTSGPQWAAIKNRVRANSMSFLQGALAAEDIVIPCGDGFLIVYADAASRDISREAEILQEALHAFYLGDEATNQLQVQVQTHSLSARELVGMLSKSEQTTENSSPEIRLAPIVNTHLGIIVGYRATPSVSVNGVRQFGYNPDYRITGMHDNLDYLDIDLMSLDKAAAEAARVCDSAQRCLLYYSLHVTTLRSRTRRERVLQRLAETPAHVRRLMMGRIAEIEVGTPLSSLVEWVGMLRRSTPAVSLEFHHSERTFFGLQNTRALVAGFTLPAVNTVNEETRLRWRSLIARWRSGLLRQDMALFVDGIDDPSTLSTAWDERVDYISSERSWPSETQAMGVRMVSPVFQPATLSKIA